jgi:hypothetical protein
VTHRQALDAGENVGTRQITGGRNMPVDLLLLLQTKKHIIFQAVENPLFMMQELRPRPRILRGKKKSHH